MFVQFQDSEGNVSDPVSASIKLDTTGPAASIGGVPAGWVNHPVPLSFAADDGAGAGVETIEYKIGDGAWTTGTAATVSVEGATLVSCRATDKLGNAGPETSATISIDKHGPLVTAFPVGVVKRCGSASFKYKVTDTYSPSAAVTLKVRDLHGRTVATWPAGSVTTGAAHTYQTKVMLGRGLYTVEFDAVDLAGNSQRLPGFAVLLVY